MKVKQKRFFLVVMVVLMALLFISKKDSFLPTTTIRTNYLHLRSEAELVGDNALNDVVLTLDSKYNIPAFVDKGIINTDGVLLIKKGSSASISYVVSPNQSVSFSSSNTSVVTSTNSGVITAKTTGRAVINVCVTNNPEICKTLMVVVASNYDMILIKGKGSTKIIDVSTPSTVSGSKNPVIQSIAVGGTFYYFSYPSVSSSAFGSENYKNNENTKNVVMRCTKESCETTKRYMVFTNAGHGQQFDEFNYDNVNYFLLNSKGFEKYLSTHEPCVNKTCNGGSKDFYMFNVTSNSKKWYAKISDANKNNINLKSSSTFVVPVGNVNSSTPTGNVNADISVDSSHELLAIRHGDVVSIYKVNFSNLKLDNEISRFKINDRPRYCDTSNVTLDKCTNFKKMSYQSIIIHGGYVYVSYSGSYDSNKAGSNRAYVYTYDLLGNPVDNKKAVDVSTYSKKELEGITYFNGSIYYIAGFYKAGDVNATNRLYKIE